MTGTLPPPMENATATVRCHPCGECCCNYAMPSLWRTLQQLCAVIPMENAAATVGSSPLTTAAFGRPERAEQVTDYSPYNKSLLQLYEQWLTAAIHMDNPYCSCMSHGLQLQPMWTISTAAV